MAAPFANELLVACARREVAMRKTAYPRWEGKASIEECSEKRQLEYQMMQALVDRLTNEPAPTSQAWIACKDKTPADGQIVLVAAGKEVTLIRFEYYRGDPYYGFHNGRVVTHWMPLPAPPPPAVDFTI